MENQLPVDKAVFLDVSGASEENISFWLFERENGGSCTVGKATNLESVYRNHFGNI